MQKAYTIVIILLSQLIGNHVFAQRLIHGVVQDSLGIPLKSVNVRLFMANDTISISTNSNGEYEFENITSSFVYLTFNMLGYKEGSIAESLIDKKKSHRLPIVKLKNYFKLLPSIDVVHVLPMVVNGDTTQYNFLAFNFRKNALLEEALKEIPGFQVFRDGSVAYNGRMIRKVRVDNRDFFGGDLLTATRNLPADFIKNIQLLNANAVKDDNTGIMREDDEKILNITLKEDKKRILFGQGTIGAGTNERYLGSFGLNRFDKGRELSLLGSFNNTNTNLFTFGNPGGGERVKSTGDIDAFSDPIDGLNTIGSLGLNISDQINENISFNAAYNYLYQLNNTEGNSVLTSTYTNNTIHRKEDYIINTEDKNHKIRFGLDMKFKNKDIFKVHGDFFISQQNVRQVKEMLFANSKSTSEGLYQDTARVNSPNGDLNLFYSKFFKKKGRKFLTTLNLTSNNLSRSNTIKEDYLEYTIAKLDTNQSRQNHFISQRNHTNTSTLKLSYVEPFTESSLLELSYEYEGTSINSLRLVEDQLMGNSYRFIDSLTVNYDYLFSSHRGSLIYQYEPNKKLKMNVGFAVQPLLMEGYLPTEGVTYNFDNVNLIPTANFLYKFTKEVDFQFSYKGKSNQPYFNQIAPVIDNTNSKNIIIGNPKLKAEYAHRLAATFRKSMGSRMQYFETNFAYNFILNKIVSDKKTLSQSNIQETTFNNTTGYYDWKWYYTFTSPIINEDFQLDYSGTTDYYNHLSFIDLRKRTTKQLILNQALQFKYNFEDYFESSLSANYSYNQVRYAIPSKVKVNIETLFLGLGAKGYLHDSWALGLEISQRFNDGYKNTTLNVNQSLMNSFIEYTFLRNKSALLRLQAYDLFNQNRNSGIISEYIGNDVYEARNNCLGRYFMLSLNVRLQKLPK